MNPVLTAKSKRIDDDIITKFRIQLLDIHKRGPTSKVYENFHKRRGRLGEFHISCNLVKLRDSNRCDACKVKLLPNVEIATCDMLTAKSRF